MEGIGELSSGRSNGAETLMPHPQQIENYYKDSHREVKDSYKKLQSWREESKIDDWYCDNDSHNLESINTPFKKRVEYELQPAVGRSKYQSQAKEPHAM